MVSYSTSLRAKFFFAVLFFATVFFTIAPSKAATTIGPKTSFCVQTFNIFAPLYAPFKDERIALLGDFLQQEHCDVLQFQEVWTDSIYEKLSSALNSGTSGWRGINFNEIIAAGETDVGAHVGLSTFVSSGPVFARMYLFPVNFDVDFTPFGALDLIRKTINTRKAISVVRNRVVDGQDVFFVNVHTHPTSQDVRIAQAIFLIRVLENLLSKDIPVVLTGDFNAQPGSLEMELLRTVLLAQDTLKWRSDCTYCFSNPNYIGLDTDDKRFDYILYFSSRSAKLIPTFSSINVRSHKGVYLSDHFGVRSFFQVQKLNQSTPPDTIPFVTAETRRANALGVLSQAMNHLASHSDDPDYQKAFREAFDIFQRIKRSSETDTFVQRLRATTL